MFAELPQNLIIMTGGAFIVGWMLSSMASMLGGRRRARRRDPRDDRIRSLEAELRVAQTDSDKARQRAEQIGEELKDAKEGIEKRDNVISHQQVRLDETTLDLKESVKKTRELRAELSDRATENIRSEVRLREVKTELEVAQASTDMLATGVLDYSIETEGEEHERAGQARSSGNASKSAS